jgi:hypothetical protein
MIKTKILLSHFYPANSGEVEKELDQLFNQGWQLISVVSNNTYVQYLFTRETPTKKEAP